MGNITEPSQVKLFIGMLSNEEPLFEEVENQLSAAYGNINFESPVWLWEHTKYYSREMGEGLKRRFVFFEQHINPGEISNIKVQTNEIEKQFLSNDGGRRINLDPGYLDSAKLVLVSTKNFSHRVYLDKGIYGEATLIYSGDNFQPLPYTFPDYKTEAYLALFKEARRLFKECNQIV
jgi:hypothetical protein